MFRIKSAYKELKSKIEELIRLENDINKRIDKLESTILNGNQIRNDNILNRLNVIEREINERLDKSEKTLLNQITFDDNYILNVFIPNIESYINNEILKQQGVSEHTADYKYISAVHALLKACKSDDTELVRVGRENDGGYVMAKPFSEGKIAYSLGICDDVSWDLNMAEMGYEIYQYDHTIEGLPELNESFHWFKVGLTGEKETDELKHLDTLIKENGHENESGMVLKMDIEGFEWSVINQSSEETLKKFDQIVMEIHNINSSTNKEEIIRALEKLNKTHGMVHIHANNNIGQIVFNGNYITADALEITLLNREKYNLKDSEIIVPTNIDQVNNTYYRDLFLGKW